MVWISLRDKVLKVQVRRFVTRLCFRASAANYPPVLASVGTWKMVGCVHLRCASGDYFMRPIGLIRAEDDPLTANAAHGSPDR